MSIEPKQTFYQDECFRSRIEARWSIVFDELDLTWEYEPKHYELGLKNIWDDEDQEQFENDLSDCWDDEQSHEIKREAWWKKNEKIMYLPDFYLEDFQCWVEIKGKSPNFEEVRKANLLAHRTGKSVHVLWGYIPDPYACLWGECTSVYGKEKTGILARFVMEFGVKAVQKAFIAARRERFKSEED